MLKTMSGAAVAALVLAGPVIAAEKKVPYWASIGAAKARMRTGPGRTYPASWIFVRPDLPVKVVATLKEWRKVEDPAGTQGWMLANLLSEHRTGFVPNGPNATPVELREQPGMSAKVAWRAAPGVVGKLSQCVAGWCRLDVHGQAGFVQQERLWGTDPAETLP